MYNIKYILFSDKVNANILIFTQYNYRRNLLAI